MSTTMIVDAMEAGVIDCEESVSTEEYLVGKARAALNVDPYEAKTYMLIAQNLYPRTFYVQFEAYQIEKSTKNIKEAAKCFTALLTEFSNELELGLEVQAMTTAVRKHEESNGNIENAEYLVQLFFQLPRSIQCSLLISCAEKTPDNMDHCKLMLLLFRMFPSTISTYGGRLMENLITAEKHIHHNVIPINAYRKLLVCDLLPLLGHSQMELSAKSLHRLLDKAVEFYLMYVFEPQKRGRKEEGEIFTVEEPWQRLWEVVLSIGTKIGWELCVTFGNYWNKDNYVKAITSFSKVRQDEGSQKQVALCAMLTLLRCVHEYNTIIEPTNGDPGFTLVEAFCQQDSTQPLKAEEDVKTPVLTCGVNAPSNLVHTFLAAVRCLDLLVSNEILSREYVRLRAHFKAEPCLRWFLLDAYLYQGLYDQTIVLIQNRTTEDVQKINPIVPELILLTCHCWTNNHVQIVDLVSKIAGMLPSVTVAGSGNGNDLTITTRRQRHLHYLPLTRTSVLNYCVKTLLTALRLKKNDLALGHILVLIQLNWPTESEILSEVTEMIERRGGFIYPIFSNYIINLSILEQFSYLASDSGPKIPLDILPAGQQIHSQRRMSTRGVDKGVKEDLKMTIRSLVARSNEPIDDLVLRFLKRERDYIHHSLITK